MNNIWTTLILVIVCVFASYYLSLIWIPFGWLGWLLALGLVGTYIFKRNKRIQ